MEKPMKSKIFVLGAMLMASGAANAGMIDVTACDARGGTAAVVIAGAGGKWVGFSARTSSGKIIDVPPVKKSKFGWAGSGSRMFRFGANKNVTEVRSSTWKRYNKKTNLMEERMDDTGWVSCR
jgi:hypothetical protein